MSNKLSLLVNFVGVDRMSGALKSIVGLGHKGSKSLRQLARESKNLTRELKDIGRQSTSTGFNVTGLSEREAHLRGQLAAVNTQLEKQQRLAAINADRMAMLRRASELKSKGQDNMIGGAAMAIPLIFATRQAMTFESAMADVRKVVDFPTPKAFAQMSDDVLTLSTRIPMAAEEIAAIVAAAGRANIPRKELLRFAEDSAKLGVAFDMTGDEAGAMMAKWRTAFGMGQADVVRLSDQVNALTNRYGGNATAVAGIITRIGALGEVSGVAASQIGAMAQLLDSVGVGEEVASTGIKNMMLALTKGEAATKAQATALASLGLNATDLAARMQKDAGGAITDVLTRIQRLPKEAQSGLLTQLFGSESIAAIAPMLTNLDKLRANLALVGDATAYTGSMQKEYLARIATSEGATGLAANALKALNMELGAKMLPAVTEGSHAIVSIAQSLRAWSKENPAVSTGIATIFSALVGLKIGLGVTQFAFGSIISTFASAQKVLGQGKVIFGGLRTAVLFLGQGFLRAGVMMLANPIFWIPALIAAIAALAVAIYVYWDEIKAGVSQGVAWLRGKFDALPAWMQSIGKMMMAGLLMAINPMALAKKLIDMAWNGITAFKAYLGIKSPSRVFMALGGHVAGGLERGIDGNRDGPARAAGRMAAGVMAAGAMSLTPAVGSARAGLPAEPRGNVTYEIHIHQQPGEDAQALARRVMEEIERAKARSGRSSFED